MEFKPKSFIQTSICDFSLDTLNTHNFMAANNLIKKVC